ncbi:MAG TPA: hypothetical protein VMT12_11370 [Syntrophales bacterium]|nr:hypothetical protein [Syntrophales bacterium]
MLHKRLFDTFTEKKAVQPVRNRKQTVSMKKAGAAKPCSAPKEAILLLY